MAELAVEAKESVADKRVYKPWREEPVNSGADAPAATRRWVLQSVFGVKRKAVEDLEFLGSVAKQFDGKPGQEQDGFDVQARSVLVLHGVQAHSMLKVPLITRRSESHLHETQPHVIKPMCNMQSGRQCPL